MPLERPTRRTLIKAGAWTAPAVVAMSAAPAFAASTTTPTSTLTVNRGQTRYVPGFFSYVAFNQFTITPDTTSTGPLTLRLTCSSYFYGNGDVPSGWLRSGALGQQAGSPGTLYTYTNALTAGVPILFGTDDALYADDDNSGGTYILTISAPGFTTVVQTYGPDGTTRPGPTTATAPNRRPGGQLR